MSSISTRISSLTSASRLTSTNARELRSESPTAATSSAPTTRKPIPRITRTDALIGVTES
jgi:hypothetical protein